MYIAPKLEETIRMFKARLQFKQPIVQISATFSQLQKTAINLINYIHSIFAL
jgi:hypothetical protein